MKKVFFLMLLSCLTCVYAWGDTYVAQIGEEKYTTLQAAITAVPENQEDETEIELINDVTVNAILTIPSTKKVKLNLNSYAITSTYNSGDMGLEDFDKDCLFLIKGTLHVVSKGKGIVQRNVTTGSSALFANQGTLIVDGGVFVGSYQDAYGWGYKMPVIFTDAGSNTTINGGTFLCNERISDYRKGFLPGLGNGPFVSYGGSYTINGGIFSESELVDLLSHASTKTFLEGKITSDYKVIKVPYTNANVDGYNSWRTSASNSDRYIPACDNMVGSTTEDKALGVYQHYRYEVKPVCMVVPDEENTENFLLVDKDVTMTIEEGQTLRVGTHGIAFADANTSKIVVAPGATLLSEGDIISSSGNNIELTMDARANKYSTLALKAGTIQGKHPNAKVTLKAMSSRKVGRTPEYRWQRFAIPTYMNNVTVADFVGTRDYTTYMYQLDYAHDAWVAMTADEVFHPFVGYNMTISAEDVTPDYTFTGELVGKGNPSIHAYHGWNFLANSYTAPIDTKAMLKDFIGQSSSENSAAVWIQHEPGSKDWDDYTFANVFFGDDIESIQPMRAFLINRLAPAGEFELNYAKYVSEQYWPTGGGSAPSRRAPQLYEDIERAIIIVKDANNKEEKLSLYLSNDFSDGFDNGFDAQKYENEERFNFYAVTTDGIWSAVASNDLENTSITIDPKDATSFTMSFDKVTLDGYQIVDLKNNTITDIKAGNEYAFTAEEKEEGRFMVIMKSEVDPTTSIEDAATSNRIHNGIYTLTGQYMGNNINLLPAGVYVVNGKKVVK